MCLHLENEFHVDSGLDCIALCCAPAPGTVLGIWEMLNKKIHIEWQSEINAWYQAKEENSIIFLVKPFSL